MAAGPITLVGIAGLVEGDTHAIALGETVTIGRSRDCDIALRADADAKTGAGKTSDVAAARFRTVSRMHATIAYEAPDRLTITDHSSTGTFLDGVRISGSAAIDPQLFRPHELRLGASEAFRVQLDRGSEAPSHTLTKP